MHAIDMIEFEYRRWSVSRKDREPLLRFLVEGLEQARCRILHASDPSREPFLITFETLSGERHGVLCYAFLANSRMTKNRPDDEHRFQVKLGSDTKAILDLEADASGLITTLFVGIDPVRRIIVAADPVLHDPTPMFMSIEFKRRHAEAIMAEGWHAWERRSERQAHEPVEVLVGARQDRVLDLIRFERAARGLDQGHRQLLAEKLATGHERVAAAQDDPSAHRLIAELGLDPATLFDLIDEAGRLKMAVRGWVAEVHLEDFLRDVPGVTDCQRLNAEGQPDLQLVYRGRGPFLVECKNVLRALAANGNPRLDFQRTRASKSDPCSRYYQPAEFGLVAACLHAVTERWEFRFATTASLPEHEKCPGRIRNTLRVDDAWYDDAAKALDMVAGFA